MDKIADLLASLAAKLGTTVEYLWPKLVERTKYEWLGGMLSCLIVLGIGLYCTRIAVKAWRERVFIIEDRWGNKESMVPNIDFLFSALAVIFMFLGTIFTLVQVSTISDFLAPEATTILDLLERIKK